MKHHRTLATCTALALASIAAAAEKPETPDAWEKLGPDRLAAAERFAGDYMHYLDNAQTEILAVTESLRLARDAGFRPLEDGRTPRPGDGLAFDNRGRAVLLVRVGRRPLEDGLRMIATHIDSPRLDVKARPLYEKEGLVLMQTISYGGIKNYQWANVPLALVGRVYKTDGSEIDVRIGFDASDPVFVIPDLAPHVDRPRRERKSREAIQDEELDPVAGSMRGEDGVKAAVLAILEERHGIADDDFVSGELYLVPATFAREVGFDRGLILAYGHDDKLCSYAGLRAVLDEREPEYWTAIYLANYEEAGSRNNTGAKSEFLEDVIGRLLETSGEFDQRRLRRTFRNTVVASGDVTTGVNPMDASVQETTNAARLNGGVVIKRYGRGNDPNARVLAWARALIERADIAWQTHTFKVGVGGGGTLGGFLSVRDMEVFDIGAAVLSIHSPAEIASKADVYSLYLFLQEFVRDHGDLQARGD